MDIRDLIILCLLFIIGIILADLMQSNYCRKTIIVEQEKQLGWGERPLDDSERRATGAHYTVKEEKMIESNDGQMRSESDFPIVEPKLLII